MDLRSAVLGMINSVSGKWVVASAHLGMSESALKNRAYETKGQSLSTSDALALQQLSGTTLFAEAIATISVGTFVALPPLEGIDNDSIHAKFNETYREIGRVFETFTEATKDGVIDRVERAALEELGVTLHKKTEDLLALMFTVYCPRRGELLSRGALEASSG